MLDDNFKPYQKLLAQGATAMGCDLSSVQQQQLMDYLVLLEKWNQTHNLTAIRDAEQMVTHHLLDSLSVVPYIKGKTILDVGTGGGVPGIPLAIFCTEKQFTLVDSNGKKIRFLCHVVQQLGLENVTVVHSRVEQLSQTPSFDVIMARAVGTLVDLLQWTQPLLKAQGCWVLMKGLYPQQELQAITMPNETIKLSVPGIDAQRHVVVIKNTG